ncbi:hypothetical protein ACIHEI_06785 [Kitasatospora sp. NPDC051984]|uniref:DUF7507 domain-containing protein n=1 Tax=Kitasatospora sp. NPDC051984 TaxID=3364059 RepID=UPI0037C80E35
MLKTLRPSWTGRRLLAGVACALAALGPAALPSAAVAPTVPRAGSGTLLVSETFTGATADPAFVATSGACLTGAPATSTPPGSDPHPLGGCPRVETGPVPPENGAPHGYLQLTDAGHDRTAAVLYERALPAHEGMQVSFEQWQYGGDPTEPRPADGISFFLVDGAAPLTRPGAYGGSLGYAQKLPDDNPANPFIPGVEDGYLGVGLDVLGNYFGDWEHRGNGCPPGERSPAGTGFRVPAPGPNVITLRGPGNGTTGYCYLAATTSNQTTTPPWPSTLPGELQGPTTAADLPPGITPEQAEIALLPSKRTVTVTVTPTPDPQVEVDVDFGSGPVRVLSTPAPQPVPATYKFGFASSTGDFTDVHLLRNVVARSVNPLPQLDLVKQIDRTTPLPDPVTAGTVVPYQFVVTNAGGSEIRDLVVTDPQVGAISCPTTTLAVDETVTCTGSYTVTEEDVRRGFITNVAVANGDSDSGPVTSPEADHTLPLTDNYGLLLEKRVDDSREYLAGETATYTYTVTNTTDRTVSDLAVLDDRLTDVTCESTTLTPAETPGAVTTCTGSYTVTEADAKAGVVRNTAHATGNAPERTVTSPPAQEEIAVRAEEPSPSPSPSPKPSHSEKPTEHPTEHPSEEPTKKPVERPNHPGELPKTGSGSPLVPLLLSAGLGVAGLFTLRWARRRG